MKDFYYCENISKKIKVNASKMNGFTLRKLIQIIYPKFKKSLEKHTIISAAHTTNKPSIALHEKLGFYTIEKQENRIIYECRGIEFVKNLEKYI